MPVQPVSSDEQPRLRVVSEEESGSPYPKCSLLLRAGARLLDAGIAYGLYVLGGRPGAVLALLFLLFADGLLQGQSLGKRMFGIKAVYVPTRMPARFRESVLRNAPFGLMVLLGMMPELGKLAFYAGVVVIGGIEAWKVIREPLGLRLGDVWAQTQVVDGKVVAGNLAEAGAPQAAEGQITPRAAPRSSEEENQKCGSR